MVLGVFSGRVDQGKSVLKNSSKTTIQRWMVLGCIENIGIGQN